jgi:hypothetical protein
MELPISIDTELLPPKPIRVETALSRFPVHRLAKRGDITIDIREVNESGELSIKWEVDYGKKQGQPGPLAYKLDTLIVNRKIEEATRPIPRIIRLGSLKEIAAQLGLGGDTNLVKNALRQNASTFITAKIRYRQHDGTERTLEADFTRYSVVFTGEELPDGRKADAVYIVLNDIYMQVINGAMTRPLDYDYLKSLPPAPQRFYEVLSYQIYAALKHGRPRAKLTYSEFCTYAPQTRHFDWERVRSQMNKVHRPHRKSGYLAAIDIRDTVDGDGRSDWLMLYTPGPKARAEYRAFVRRGGPVVLAVEPLPLMAVPAPTLPVPGPSPLEAELIDRGVTPAMAVGLVRDHGEEEIRAQIEHLDWLTETKPGKVADPSAWLVAAVRNGHAAPKGFVSKAERQRREEARQSQEREKAEQRRRQREQEDRDQAERKAVDAYLQRLTPAERKALEAEALSRAGPEARQSYEQAAPARFRATVLQNLVRKHVAQALGQDAVPAG